MRFQARHAAGAEQRVALLHTIADLYETQLGDLEMRWKRTLGRSPRTQPAKRPVTARARCADATMRHGSPRLRGTVAKVSEPQIAALLHVKRRRIRENMLATWTLQSGHYRRVLELDPSISRRRVRSSVVPAGEQYEALAGIYLARAGCCPNSRPEAASLSRRASSTRKSSSSRSWPSTCNTARARPRRRGSAFARPAQALFT